MNKPTKIELVVFDWAGTTTDFGSQAPAVVFHRIFSQYGLHFSREDINAPMGMEKRSHIKAMLSTEKGLFLCKSVWGREWNEKDIEVLYQGFENALKVVVAEYSQVLPGVVDTVEQLRAQGIKIGSTTGYTSEIMQSVVPVADAGGYTPDSVVTPDITGSGRPSPFLLYECMRRAGVYPASHVVKVGDTVMDILEGKNAGTWTVGILTGSNLVGLSQQEYDQASTAEVQTRKDLAKKLYLKAGADLVIDSIRELPAAIDLLNARLARQEAFQ